jgi:hypothetical protein
LKYHYYSQNSGVVPFRHFEDAGRTKPIIGDSEVLSWFAEMFPESDLEGLTVEMATV